MNRTSIPNLLLERYILGEVTPEERARIDQAIARDPALQVRIKEMREDSRRILGDYPPRMAEIAIREKAANAGRRSPRALWLGLSSAVVTAAALVVVLNSGLFERATTPGNTGAPPGVSRPVGSALEKTRLKGGTRLMVFRHEGDNSVPLDDGAPAVAGDVIQLKYLAGDATHGVIFSIDGRGTVTLHYPTSEDGSTELDARGPQALHRAYELDDAPDFERFFLVYAGEPLPVTRILDAAEALGAAAGEGLELPGDWTSVDLLLRKSEVTP